MWNLKPWNFNISTMASYLTYFAAVIAISVAEVTSQTKCDNAYSCWAGQYWQQKCGVCTGKNQIIGQINAAKHVNCTSILGLFEKCWCDEYNSYAPDKPKDCWEKGTPTSCLCNKKCPDGILPNIRKENCEFVAEFNPKEHCATPGSTITTSIPISDNAQGSCAPPAKCTITTSAPPAKSNITTSDFHVSNAVWAILVLEIIICIGVGVIIYKLSLIRQSPAPSPPSSASVTLSSSSALLPFTSVPADIQQVLGAVTSLANTMERMEASVTGLRTTFSTFQPSSADSASGPSTLASREQQQRYREVDLHPTLRDTQV